ncbi:MAG TPA: hypothetical protein VFF09_01560 [archaeon]|nr:hypothetical protein [archaeon]
MAETKQDKKGIKSRAAGLEGELSSLESHIRSFDGYSFHDLGRDQLELLQRLRFLKAKLDSSRAAN